MVVKDTVHLWARGHPTNWAAEEKALLFLVAQLVEAARALGLARARGVDLVTEGFSEV